MTTTILFTRYDVCPNCSSRVNLYEDNDTIVEETLVYCKCGYIHSIKNILDYWSSYYLDKDLD